MLGETFNKPSYNTSLVDKKMTKATAPPQTPAPSETFNPLREAPGWDLWNRVVELYRAHTRSPYSTPIVHSRFLGVIRVHFLRPWVVAWCGLGLLFQVELKAQFKLASMELIGEWPGYSRGPAKAVRIHGKRAYLALGQGGLLILDVSQPSAPQRLGELPLGTVRDVWAEGNIAYVASYGLTIVDVSDPAHPKELGRYQNQQTCFSVEVENGLAYVATSQGLEILDVGNPSKPLRLGGFKTNRNAIRVRKLGNRVYLWEEFVGIQVLEITDPSSPRQLAGGYTWPFMNPTGSVVGSVFYLEGPRSKTSQKTLQAIDLSNPEDPRVLGIIELDVFGTMDSIEVVGNTAYVADNGNLKIIDFSRPESPTLIGTAAASGRVHRIQVVNGTAYLAKEAGLQVIDARKLWSPSTAAHFPTDGLTRGLHVVGSLAYLAEWGTGLQIVDISDPAKPRRIGGTLVGGGESADKIQIVGGRAYVVDMGLKIIDVTNPVDPRLLGGWWPSRSQIKNLKVDGRLAYLANQEYGIDILDVSNPADPQRIGGLETGGVCTDLELMGTLLFAATGPAGLQVIDVRDPRAPRRVGSLNLGQGARGVQMASRLNMSDGVVGLFLQADAGLHILDVADPTNPRLLGGMEMIPSGGFVSGWQIEKDLLYLPENSLGGNVKTGLAIYRVQGVQSQSIKFSLPDSTLFSRGLLALSAVASSGLPVGFRVLSGPATIEDGWLKPKGPGTVVVRAEQSGNDQFRLAFTDQTMNVFGEGSDFPSLRISSARDRRLQLSVRGTQGSAQVLQFSSDLIKWFPLSTNPTPVALDIQIPTENDRCFYRVVVRE